MSKEDELKIANYLDIYLNRKFNNSKYDLNKWGQVDDWIKISDNTYLFLEVETSQKHPNTNVLKLWPLLEENQEIRIFLIQTFFTNSPQVNKSRGKLGEWTGRQFEKIYHQRFKYYKVIFEKEKLEINSNKLKENVDRFFN